MSDFFERCVENALKINFEVSKIHLVSYQKNRTQVKARKGRMEKKERGREDEKTGRMTMEKSCKRKDEEERRVRKGG